MLAGGTRQNVMVNEKIRSKRRVFGKTVDAGKLLITIKRCSKIVKYKFYLNRGIVSTVPGAANTAII